MYNKLSNLVLGFHGCDKSVRDAVINGGELVKSINSYDWLGNGFYFWENNEERALQWAEYLASNPNSKITHPSVLGAVIDLGNCLDLMSSNSITTLQLGYDFLKSSYEKDNTSMPVNKNIGSNTDLLLRPLDCAVIEKIHSITQNPEYGLEPYDSVRGLFIEGNEVYPGSGFREKTHVQICVVNPNCIKGYFIPRSADENYKVP
ncbi:MAG: hypothetical protein NC293_11820 [Roseburia sp.]|nr:hypothetical protein [Roseburia sp.]